MTYPVEFFLSEMVDAPVSFCCQNSCGLLVPLVANGSYNGPSGDGKTRIYFNLSNSPFCGISVARVLRGDLDSLAERDDLAILNPKSGSMRLRIGVSNLSFVNTSHQLTCVDSGRATKNSCERLAASGIRVYSIFFGLTVNTDKHSERQIQDRGLGSKSVCAG